MFKNNRGEVVTLTLMTVAIVSILLGLFARPVANKLLPGFLGTDQKIVTNQEIKTEPVWIKNPDGSQTLFTKTDIKYGSSDTPVPLTLFQKIQQLGVIYIIIIAL